MSAVTLATVRASLATAVQAAGYKAHAQPLATVIPPAVVIGVSTQVFNPGVSDPEPIVPNGLVYRESARVFYEDIPEVREAALAIAVDVFQSRVAPGGQTEAIDFTPGPYRMGRSLISRVSGLLARWMDTSSLVG